jgi:hypothetical protein
MERMGKVDFRASGVALDSSALIYLMKSKTSAYTSGASSASEATIGLRATAAFSAAQVRVDFDNDPPPA